MTWLQDNMQHSDLIRSVVCRCVQMRSVPIRNLLIYAWLCSPVGINVQRPAEPAFGIQKSSGAKTLLEGHDEVAIDAGIGIGLGAIVLCKNVGGAVFGRLHIENEHNGVGDLIAQAKDGLCEGGEG